MGAQEVGYADADLSTSPEELSRLAKELEVRGVHVVLGSRVRLLGAQIDRRPLRHYLGRLFASVASLALRLPVYDTQCGAKFFRAGPALRHALAEPFHSRWAFDVELIGRLLRSPETPLSAADFVEVPLRHWADVNGSKLSPLAALRAGFDLFLIGYRLRRRGRGARA